MSRTVPLSVHLRVPEDQASSMALELYPPRNHTSSFAILPRDYVVGVTEPGTENMNREHLLAIIDDIRERVRMGDCMEGTLTFTLAGYDDYVEWQEGGCTGPQPEPQHPYDVEARYRTGNLYGQGSMRMIGVKVAGR